MKHDKIHRVIPTGLLLSEMDMIQIKGGDGDDKPPVWPNKRPNDVYHQSLLWQRQLYSAVWLHNNRLKVCAYSWREFQAYAHVLLNFNKV